LVNILIMIGIAWFLDRAAKVPDLFVGVSKSREGEAALEGESMMPGARVAVQ
jgi:hypothetical protein